MKTASGGAGPRAALLAFGWTWAGLCLCAQATAQEPTAISYILPAPDQDCDEQNRSWSVTSQHTYLSIKVVVRWTAAGGKEVQEEFILAPGKSRALGCAAKLEVVSAEIMQF